MSAVTDEEFQAIKTAVKAFGKPQIRGSAKSDVATNPYFQCQYTGLLSRQSFTLPPITKKIRSLKSPATAKKSGKKDKKDKKESKEEESKEEEKLIEEKPEDAEKKAVSKKRKAPSKSKELQTYGSFMDPVVACAAVFHLITRDSAWLPGSKVQHLSGLTLEKVVEVLSISLANICAKPAEALLTIRPLLSIARDVPDRSSLAPFGGSRPQWDATLYRGFDATSLWAKSIESLYAANPVGCFLDAPVLNNLLVAKKEQKEREAKKGRNEILCDRCARSIDGPYINEIIAKRLREKEEKEKAEETKSVVEKVKGAVKKALGKEEQVSIQEVNVSEESDESSGSEEEVAEGEINAEVASLMNALKQ